MKRKRIVGLFAGAIVVAMSSVEAIGQDQRETEVPATETAEAESPAFFRLDYSGDLWQRPALEEIKQGLADRLGELQPNLDNLNEKLEQLAVELREQLEDELANVRGELQQRIEEALDGLKDDVRQRLEELLAGINPDLGDIEGRLEELIPGPV